MAWCPFCEESSAKLKTHKDGTHYLHCERCGENYVPSAMMDDNVSILRESKKIDTEYDEIKDIEG